jgi:hypothetical protein
MSVSGARMKSVAAASLAVAAATAVAAACQPVVPYGQAPAIAADSGSLGQTSFVTGGGWKAGSKLTILFESTVNGVAKRVPASTASAKVGSDGRFMVGEKLLRRGTVRLLVYGTSWKGTAFSTAKTVTVK